MHDVSLVENRYLAFVYVGLISGMLVLVILMGMDHLEIIKFPYQVEYREGAILLNSDLLLSGGNLFALENKPLNTELYGLAYYVFLLPFSSIFGNTLPVLRAASAICIALVLIIIYSVVKRQGMSTVFAGCSAAFMYPAMFSYVTPIARPDALGVLLYLLAIVVPWFARYSTTALVWSGGLSVLAFLTKPYFALSFVIVSSYLFLFCSIRKSFLYMVVTLTLAAVVLLFVESQFETYFYEVYSIHLVTRTYEVEHLVTQLWEFFIAYWSTVVACVFAFIIWLWREPRVSRPKLRINLSKIDGPLVSTPANIFVFAAIVSLLVCVYPLGGHVGNYMSYFFQLFAPFLIIVTLTGLSKMMLTVVEKKKVVVLSVVSTLLLMNMITIRERPYIPRDVGERLPSWVSVDDYLSNFDRVLNAPPIVSILQGQKKPIYDSGMSEYFSFGAGHSEVFGARALQRVAEWKLQIMSMVENRQADVAVTVEGMPSFPPREILSQYYRIEATAVVGMTFQRWRINFWLPK